MTMSYDMAHQSPTQTLAEEDLKLYMRQHKCTLKKFEDEVKRPGDYYISPELMTTFTKQKYDLIMSRGNKQDYEQAKKAYDEMRAIFDQKIR